MTAPWGMIRARQEASQAHEREKYVHETLVNLINAVEAALKELQEVEASKHVQEKLQKAIKDAQDEMRGARLS
jgi:hypothetical protein